MCNPFRCLNTAQGFTLIELILVMTLLVIVISLVVPSLKRFIGGRGVDSEVRRFVALTHYGQSRAASEGIPMLLWIDPKARAYGLEQEPGYTDNDPKAEQFTLGEGLSINFRTGTKMPTISKSIGIRFSPDGSVATVNSVSAVSIQEGNSQPTWVGLSSDGLSYEVQSQSTVLANARR